MIRHIEFIRKSYGDGFSNTAIFCTVWQELENNMRNSSQKSFDDYVISDILNSNKYSITGVSEIESLTSLYFIEKQYPQILKLIDQRNLDAIKVFSNGDLKSTTILEIMKFKDQNKKDYLVTVFDSLALEQNPEVIEIYLI